ncbi:hypothetical protein [Nitrobacter sp.]|uniref:hypothetical protein n=1 Tax=Nitrobacter sp. TaxID=29420 RepID=UPI00399D656C
MALRVRFVETAGDIVADRSPAFAQKAYRRINILRCWGHNSRRREAIAPPGPARRVTNGVGVVHDLRAERKELECPPLIL